MNKNNVIRKGLIIAIIVLFVGAGVIPSISSVIETDSTETNEENIHIENLILGTEIFYPTDDSHVTIDIYTGLEQEITTTVIQFQNGVMWTEGPFREWITEIDLIDGSPSEIERINKILDRPKIRLSPFAIVKVTNLDFSVTYNKKMLSIFPILSYSTVALSGEENHYVHNDVHTVTVNGLEGYFLLMKTLPLRPAHFTFTGFYNELTIE